MPTAAVLLPFPSQETMASTIASSQQPRPPLRRAVYIHVSDLTSAYNIDHARLEEELARVKLEKENPSLEAKVARLGVSAEIAASFPQKRLQPPRGGYNLCVLVGKVEVVVDKRRVDGSRVRLAEVEVGDETGTVSLRARDDQIDLLKEVSERSSAVVLRNCTLELFQGKHIRLAITKWGKLNTYPDQVASTPPPPSKMNADRNFSLIDLSLVASEMAVFPQTESYRPTEQEGQATSTQQPPGRQQPFQGSSHQSRSRGNRRSQRSKSAPAVPGVQYVDQGGMTSSIRYPPPGGLHANTFSGGYNEGMDVRQQYSYPQRRHDAPPHPSAHHHQQQQMMLQQQFEMQQRQMQQIYHHGQHDRQRPMHAGSSMLGAPPGVQPATSFDTTFSVGSEQLPVNLLGTNPFQMPIQGSPAPHPGHPGSTHLGTTASRPESPGAHGKMNPQAATFDPSYGKPMNK